MATYHYYLRKGEKGRVKRPRSTCTFTWEGSALCIPTGCKVRGEALGARMQGAGHFPSAHVYALFTAPSLIAVNSESYR
jgi:hypothetical protein